MRRRNTKKSNMKNPTAEAALPVSTTIVRVYTTGLASANKNGGFCSTGRDKLDDRLPGISESFVISNLFQMKI